MYEIFIAMIIFLTGLIIGSFSNVCIYRIPRNESLISPGSHCPQCSKPILFYDNIPLISYLLLKGKCRNCGQTIPVQYPLVELVTGLFYLALYLFYGLQIISFVYMLLSTLLIIISFIDLKERIIPDVISLPFMVIGFLLSFFSEKYNTCKFLLGILGGGGSLYLVAVLAQNYSRKKQWGSVKLAAMIGAF